MADLEALLLGAQRDSDAAERRAELAERQRAEAHRLILDMQVPALTGQTAYIESVLGFKTSKAVTNVFVSV